MKKIFVLVCSAMLVAACGNSSKSNQNAAKDSISIEATNGSDMHNAENSLDYVGIYKGVFSAADCPGIETTLVLNNNQTFTQSSSYIERKTSFEEKGTYTLDGNILTLKGEDGAMSYYKVEEGRVRKLNADKEMVTGDLAEHYVLTKE